MVVEPIIGISSEKLLDALSTLEIDRKNTRRP
jgi:hypothetical protein